jgi:hypothetical protein
MRRGAAALSLACALMLAITGCKSNGASGNGGAKGGGTAAAAGPPPGGWPQPENGQLTTKMCGLLTDADYQKYGHQRLPVVSQKRSDNLPNAVDCLYMTNDELSLNLEPTTSAAKIAYAGDLKDHKERLNEDQRPTILAQNVVQGADESWFDYWTLGTADSKFKEYQIDVRRGSLIVDIVLSGIKGKTEQDPRTLLTGLAGLVLQRIPNVGKGDTGKDHKVRFSIIGPGSAKQISYNDPTTAKAVTLKNVKLPWHTDKALVNTGQAMVILNLTAVPAAPMAQLGCNIQVDGETVVREDPRIGFTSCMKTFTPPK